MEKIEVIIRARPQTITEISTKETPLTYTQTVSPLDLQNETQHKHSSFLEILKNFPLFFPPETQTKTIFDLIVLKYLKSWSEGFNVSLFMYGQTGTGKTYTILGDFQQKGVLYLSIEEIMGSIGKLNDLKCSYIEIYNDNIYDLLSENIGVSLSLNEDATTKEFFIKDVVMIEIKCLEGVEEIIKQGEKNRHYAETMYNHCSSRSHTIFRFSYKKNNGERCFFNFVDLAGSERISTEPDDLKKCKGTLIPETKSINKSLFFLTHVITMLAKGETNYKLIPYRNSPLTKLLRSSLAGNAQKLMVLCLNPCISQIDQTINTLRFGVKAKKVQIFVEKFDKTKSKNKIISSEKISKNEDLKYMNQLLMMKEKEVKDLQLFTNKLSQMVLFYQNRNTYGLWHLNQDNLKLIELDIWETLSGEKMQQALYQLNHHEELQKVNQNNIIIKGGEEIRFFNEEFYKNFPETTEYSEQQSTITSLDEFCEMLK